MTLPAHACSVVVRVPFHDCDPLGIVWHGRYFEYFEVARCELLRAMALDVKDLQQLQLRMFVTEVRCRYTAPMHYADDVKVTAWLSEQGAVLSEQGAVLSEQGAVLSEQGAGLSEQGAVLSEQGAVLQVSYAMTNLTTGRRCARAFTRLALTDADGGLLTVLPGAVRQRLPRAP